MDLEKTLYDLCLPFVTNEQALSVKTLSSSEKNEIHLHVYADEADISRLIGRRGSIANALRSMMNAAVRSGRKKVMVKFETY